MLLTQDSRGTLIQVSFNRDISTLGGLTSLCRHSLLLKLILQDSYYFKFGTLLYLCVCTHAYMRESSVVVVVVCVYVNVHNACSCVRGL